MWTIADGPLEAAWGGRDAVGWGWILTNERGVRHALTVWVTGTAMAIADEYLPEETVAARDTEGRSEAARLLGDEVLPREIVLGTTGRSIDPGEAGWWVELRGEAETLQTLAGLFDEGDLTIVGRGGQYFLRATEFEEMADEQEVRIRAASMVREAVGAAEIAGEAVTPIEVAAVQRVM